MKTYAIILASGRGERFKSPIPKQFVNLKGRLIIEWTIKAFEEHPQISHIIVITLKEYIQKVKELSLRNNWKKVVKILSGGETRQESSFIGVNAVEEEEAYILIHDGVRPMDSPQLISKVIETLKEGDSVGVIPAIPSTDTVIEIDESFYIKRIPLRRFCWRSQTPQGFKLSVIKRAHFLAKKENLSHFTDDCGLVWHYRLGKIKVIEGEETNIKITTPLDFYLAEKILSLKEKEK